MTSNKEDYLKAIYDAGGCDHYVSNKKLVERLGISPASVSEMLSKLHNDGLITYRAYHGSKLTEKGLSSCVDVVRNHELWVVFLIRHLGYSWWEAHEEAHHLEHVGSHMMIARLDEFLGHPKTCPHCKAQYQEYNRGGILRQKTQEGDAFGLGLGAGYSLMLHEHINLDFGLGGWGGRKVFTDYACPRCGKITGSGAKWFFMPNEITVAIMFTF